MDSSVSPKDEIWFLRVCHHISNAVYPSFCAPLHLSASFFHLWKIFVEIWCFEICYKRWWTNSVLCQFYVPFAYCEIGRPAEFSEKQHVVQKFFFLTFIVAPCIMESIYCSFTNNCTFINPYPTAFPYGNGMVLHLYQQQESSTTICTQSH